MKVINIIVAIGTAIIIGSLIQLGIQAFHPAPVSPWEDRGYTKPAAMYDAPCEKTDTKCISDRAAERDAYEAEQQKFADEDKQYQDATKAYNRDVFIIANIIGLIVFGIGFWLIFSTSLATQAAPIGIMMAGFWGIIYGYGRGWGSIGDQLKFVVGLVIAVVLVGGSIWLMQRYASRTKETA